MRRFTHYALAAAALAWLAVPAVCLAQEAAPAAAVTTTAAPTEATSAATATDATPAAAQTSTVAAQVTMPGAPATRVLNHVAHLGVDGNLAGKVNLIDNSGRYVPASINLNFVQNGRVVYQTRSDDLGNFQAVGLPPGVYSLIAGDTAGFGAARIQVLPYVPGASTNDTAVDITIIPPEDVALLMQAFAMPGAQPAAFPPPPMGGMGGGPMGGGGSDGFGGNGLGALIGLGGLAGLASLIDDESDGDGSSPPPASPFTVDDED